MERSHREPEELMCPFSECPACQAAVFPTGQHEMRMCWLVF